VLRDNLERIRNEPSLLVIEVAWRWLFGAVAIALLAFAVMRFQQAVVISPSEEAQLTSASPDSMLLAAAAVMERALPVAARLVAILLPALLVFWIVAVSAGRAVILAKLVGPDVRIRWTGFVGTHFLRGLSVVGLATAYVASSSAASLISQSYIVIFVIFLSLFVIVLLIWSWIHWLFSLATLYPVLQGLGTAASLGQALRLIRHRAAELSGIATGNGTARTVLALVFTLLGLLPLPLYRIAPGLLIALEIVIALAYCVISDWFLLARLVGYLEIATAHAAIPEKKDSVIQP
jgi:hypothetical protein